MRPAAPRDAAQQVEKFERQEVTAGKQADLLVTRAEDINNMPLNDAVGTLVLGTDARNIEVVLVAGNPRKWAGDLVGENLAELRENVIRSRDDVVRRQQHD